MERAWNSEGVLAMLGSDPNACRPHDLPEQYGLKDKEYFLSPDQAQAILELRLHRLTGLEQEKLINDYKELLKQISEYMEILANNSRLMEVIRTELEEINESYGDERKN